MGGVRRRHSRGRLCHMIRGERLCHMIRGERLCHMIRGERLCHMIHRERLCHMIRPSRNGTESVPYRGATQGVRYRNCGSQRERGQRAERQLDAETKQVLMPPSARRPMAVQVRSHAFFKIGALAVDALYVIARQRHGQAR